jgi:hypothetical protein
MAIIHSDTFGGAGGDLPGQTLEVGGLIWQEDSNAAGDWTNGGGLAFSNDVLGGGKTSPSSSTIASYPTLFINPGSPDVEVSCELNPGFGIALRMQSYQNFILVGLDYSSPDGGGVRRAIIATVTNGIRAEIGSVALSPEDFSRVDLKVSIRGTTLKVYEDGILKYTTSISNFSTATKHGITKAAFDNLQVTGGQWDWSDGSDNFVLTVLQPPVPTITSPFENASVPTSRPTLMATLGTYDLQSRVEYQVATNTGFSANLRTIQDTTLRDPGASSSIQVSLIQALTQVTWYMRAREIDSNGVTGPWSSTRTFVVSHAPGTINHTPTGGEGVVQGVKRFAWQFSDLNPGDAQTAYQFELQRNDTGAVLFDSGKVTSTSQYIDFNITAPMMDLVLRWRVKVWDSENVAGTYSNFNIISTAQPPTVNVTAPAEGVAVTTGAPTFEWTFVAAGGRTQASWRVVVQDMTDAGAVVHDSGIQAGATVSYSVFTNILTNAHSFKVTVSVVDNLGLVGEDFNNFTATYIAPDVPILTVNPAGYEDLGYVLLEWTSEPDAQFVKWRIYRREVETTSWIIVNELSDVDVREYKDYLTPSQGIYEYAIGQIVTRFDNEIESALSTPVQAYIHPGGYWLIDPITPEMSTSLYSVTSDSYNSVRERNELNVVGRGRHVDIGESIGKTGTLVAKLREGQGTSARSKKLHLENLIESGVSVYLRNPFGDVWLVSLGDMQVQRVAGVGPSEFVDITIPYSEVF